jgi:hypothetical protein
MRHVPQRCGGLRHDTARFNQSPQSATRIAVAVRPQGNVDCNTAFIARDEQPCDVTRLVGRSGLSKNFQATNPKTRHVNPHTRTRTNTRGGDRALWSGRRDSNPRPQPWQGCALPLSYTRILAGSGLCRPLSYAKWASGKQTDFSKLRRRSLSAVSQVPGSRTCHRGTKKIMPNGGQRPAPCGCVRIFFYFNSVRGETRTSS